MYPRVVLVAKDKIIPNERLTLNFARRFGRKRHEEVSCIDCDECMTINDPQREEIIQSEIKYHESQILMLVNEYEILDKKSSDKFVIKSVASIRSKLRKCEDDKL